MVVKACAVVKQLPHMANVDLYITVCMNACMYNLAICPFITLIYLNYITSRNQ